VRAAGKRGPAYVPRAPSLSPVLVPGYVERWRRKASGQALVEFAFVVPILLVLFLGIVDFGRAYYAGVVAEQAAREGARLGMGASPGTGIGVSEIQTQVRNALGYGCGGCPNWLGLTAAPTLNVGGYENDGTQFGWVRGGSGANAVCSTNCSGGQIQVQVSFSLPLYTGFLTARLGFSSITITSWATATMW